jgi:HPr kinase/phosphorylase
VAGSGGLDREVRFPRVQRPGLALTGYTGYIQYGRLQIVGASEIGYLRKIASRQRGEILARLCRRRISCFIVTKGLKPPGELLAAADAQDAPVLTTAQDSMRAIKQLTAFLEGRLALRTQLHGVLVDVYGLGVLISGESGIGKSECALDLIDRGHRLVADDVVEIQRVADALVGSSPELTRYHMEVRGLGIINIKDLYGVSSIRTTKNAQLVIELRRWESGDDHERLGLRDARFEVLGLELPLIQIPLAPGRNTAILIEVAARNQLLKEGGYHAARSLVERVDELVAEPSRARHKRAARKRVPARPSGRPRKG